MKNGDILFLGQYKFNDFIVEAWIGKLEKQIYSFNGTYSGPTNKRLIFSWGSFELHGKNIKFDLGDTNKIKSFALICRYIALIMNNASEEQKEVFFEKGIDLFLNGVLINKKWITYDRFFNQERQEFINYDFRDYLPTPPIEIIVDVAIKDKLILTEKKYNF